MTRWEAVRLVAALGAVEMCLVRDDPVAGPLLAQARRAAAGTAVAPLLDEAAAISRATSGDGDAGARAARKVVQALVRAATQAAQAVALAAP
ncbi:MAG: hypothetical protein KDC33_08840 [Thermoleophilia bacterium]|nr:hypothetical protein [Thermoleophilia bacterium]